ncbi:UNVERIFIED_CONTAM: Cyclin-A3-2 [Sesamum radiatum]|uniref:Cyclin-A3-2 n=1 Tax=Sesamum radiatum TaxID=300843 RepID=A0AAW2QEN2_SESRA
MADQENCTRVTRLAAKKRAAEEAMAAKQSKKKRVVLGEIQNVVSSQDVGLSKSSKLGGQNEKPKTKPKRNVKKGRVTAKETKSLKVESDPGIDVDAKYDDPQMCGAYASDIYDYLHSMEVRVDGIYFVLSFSGNSLNIGFDKYSVLLNVLVDLELLWFDSPMHLNLVE